MTAVTDTLDRLSFDYELRGDEAYAPCPVHEKTVGHVDANPSWSINIITGAHFCFSCHHRGSLASLVMDLQGLTSVDEARRWIGSDELTDVRLRHRSLTRLRTHARPVDAAEYLAFDEVSDEMAASRKLCRATCEAFGLRSDGGAWVLPVRSFDGDLMGWQIKDGKRVRNHPVGVQKSLSLFGLDLVDGEYVAVVESPLDAALCWQQGFPAVATYGTAVSNQQVMAMTGFTPVLAFDNDAPGRKATADVHARMSAYGILHKVFAEDGPKDFGDYDPDHIVSALGRASWIYTPQETS